MTQEVWRARFVGARQARSGSARPSRSPTASVRTARPARSASCTTYTDARPDFPDSPAEGVPPDTGPRAEAHGRWPHASGVTLSGGDQPLSIFLPLGATTYHSAPNAFEPSPSVWPAFSSFV
jgi:hypothetical protein